MAPLIEPPLVQPVSTAEPLTAETAKTVESLDSFFQNSEIVEFNENSVEQEGSAEVIFWAVNTFN